MPPRVVARQEGEVQARAGEKAELECVAHGKLSLWSLLSSSCSNDILFNQKNYSESKSKIIELGMCYVLLRDTILSPSDNQLV